MPIFELTQNSLAPVPRTTLHQQSFKEREDLQRLLKQSISVIGDDLFVLAEEFSQWADSRRRIDLLAIDRNGNLVVIELKRTEDGGHMELQAIRYAAMVSTLTFQQAIAALGEFQEIETSEAEAAILSFLGVVDPPENFGKAVRIILVSSDFSKELTTAVLWLNDNGIDIRCIRLRPYSLDGRTLLEVDQIIPVREAQEYTVRLKEKQEEARLASDSGSDFTRYDLTIEGQTYPRLWKRGLIRQVVAGAVNAGLGLENLLKIVPRKKLLIADGKVSGEAFLASAEKDRQETGYVFRPNRFFIDEDKLINVDGKTIAVSTQWSLRSLPLVDELIRAVPAAKMSYKESPDV